MKISESMNKKGISKYWIGRIIVVSIIMLVVTSCFEPTTKEAYIRQFEKFVDNVAKDRDGYKKKDWVYADKRFRKFSSEWYEKFKDDLSIKEQLKVGELIVRYQSLKGVNKLEQFYNEVLKEDVDKIKDKIEYYVENDMDEDLDKLVKGAGEIGDSLLQVVEGFIDDIRKKDK